MNEQEAGLIAAAELGEQARAFLDSDLGKVLIGMAMQEVEAAQQGLETVNPADTMAINRLQLQAKMGRNFKAWLVELMTEGESAISVYSQRDKQGH